MTAIPTIQYLIICITLQFEYKMKDFETENKGQKNHEIEVNENEDTKQNILRPHKLSSWFKIDIDLFSIQQTKTKE